MLETGRVHIGDARRLAGHLAPQSVHMIVTSPPYFGLRSYLPADHPDKAHELGSEPTPDEFVANLVALFAALRPALRDDGTVWLNLGDSYCSTAPGTVNAPMPKGSKANAAQWANLRPETPEGMKPKDLMGIPWMTAFALRADGWYLRSAITWAKKAPMPESVTDRPTSATEMVFLLTKSPRYYYDADAIREPAQQRIVTDTPMRRVPEVSNNRHGGGNDGLGANPAGRNARNFWLLGPSQFADAHFATFPPEIPRRAIRAGTSERGVCAACGAPWRRVVERESAPPEVFTNRNAPTDDLVYGGSRVEGKMRGQGQKLQNWRDEHPPQTTGWEATCSCNAGIRPAVVLDPCGGSGTTAQVCVEEGRDWLTFDLDARSVGWTAARLAKMPVRSLFAASAD